MIEMRGMDGAIEQARILQVSLLDAAIDEQEVDPNLIGSNLLTYCMRIQYQDKTWVLV